MTDSGPPCDVCGGNNRVARWTLRPAGKARRTRRLCRTCARAVQVAYDVAKPVRGADIIAERLRAKRQA